MRSLDDLVREALSLPIASRAQLVDRLVESLEPEIDPSHIAEIRKRVEQVDRGEVELIPGEEALDRVQQILECRLEA